MEIVATTAKHPTIRLTLDFARRHVLLLTMLAMAGGMATQSRTSLAATGRVLYVLLLFLSAMRNAQAVHTTRTMARTLPISRGSFGTSLWLTTVLVQALVGSLGLVAGALFSSHPSLALAGQHIWTTAVVLALFCLVFELIGAEGYCDRLPWPLLLRFASLLPFLLARVLAGRGGVGTASGRLGAPRSGRSLRHISPGDTKSCKMGSVSSRMNAPSRRVLSRTPGNGRF